MRGKAEPGSIAARLVLLFGTSPTVLVASDNELEVPARTRDAADHVWTESFRQRPLEWTTKNGG